MLALTCLATVLVLAQARSNVFHAEVAPAVTWCYDFRDLVDGRLDVADKELTGLGSLSDVQHPEIQQLKFALDDKTNKAAAGGLDDEIKAMEDNLQAIQMMKLMTTPGSEEWKALTKLEEEIKDKIKEAKKAFLQIANSSAAEEAVAPHLATGTSSAAQEAVAPQEAVALLPAIGTGSGAQPLTAAPVQLLSSGLAGLARVRGELAAYAERRKADKALRATVADACQQLVDVAGDTGAEEAFQGKENEKKRAEGTAPEHSTVHRFLTSLATETSQDCSVTLANAKATASLATQVFDDAKKSAGDMEDLMKRGSIARMALNKLLSGAIKPEWTEATMSGVMKERLHAMISHFDSVVVKGKATSEADEHLTAKLLESKVAASQAVTDAENCHSSSSISSSSGGLAQRVSTKNLRLHSVQL